MNLSSLTDRELTALLGWSLYLTPSTLAAARAEQRARLYVPSAPRTVRRRKRQPGLRWARTDRAAASRWLGHPWPSYDKISESARLEMHDPRAPRAGYLSGIVRFRPAA